MIHLILIHNLISSNLISSWKDALTWSNPKNLYLKCDAFPSNADYVECVISIEEDQGIEIGQLGWHHVVSRTVIHHSIIG